jgi:hypothetical protein
MTFATEDAYQAHRQRTFLNDSWWDDVGSFFQDVWNGIKNAVVAVTNFAVYVASATMDLVVQIGQELHTLSNLVISGIETVVSAVQGVFAWIGAEAAKLLDWL